MTQTATNLPLLTNSMPLPPTTPHITNSPQDRVGWGVAGHTHHHDRGVPVVELRSLAPLHREPPGLLLSLPHQTNRHHLLDLDMHVRYVHIHVLHVECLTLSIAYMNGCTRKRSCFVNKLHLCRMKCISTSYVMGVRMKLITIIFTCFVKMLVYSWNAYVLAPIFLSNSRIKSHIYYHNSSDPTRAAESLCGVLYITYTHTYIHTYIHIYIHTTYNTQTEARARMEY